jgi:hypothetical protein
MVSNEELIELANTTIQNLYKNFQNYDKFTAEKTKVEILLDDFENNLIFAEFFQNLLNEHKGKEDWYKKYIASYAVPLIEENKGKITISELVDVFVSYSKDEDDDYIIKKSTGPSENDVMSKVEAMLSSASVINMDDIIEFGEVDTDGNFNKIDAKSVDAEFKKKKAKKEVVYIEEKAPKVEKKENNIFKKKTRK